MQINDLPIECTSMIFSYLSYDELTRCRYVCRNFDKFCQKLLTDGFVRVQQYHENLLQSVKSLLPKRESDRRGHRLTNSYDTLNSIGADLGRLKMSFQKYINRGYCCFTPGKVLDEIFRLLRRTNQIVKSSNAGPRPSEILRELDDIAKMADEYFHEKLIPEYRKRDATYFSTLYDNEVSARLNSNSFSSTYNTSSDNNNKLSSTVLKVNTTSVQKKELEATDKKKLEVLEQQVKDQKDSLDKLQSVVNRQQRMLESYHSCFELCCQKFVQLGSPFTDLSAEMNRLLNSSGSLDKINFQSTVSKTDTNYQ